LISSRSRSYSRSRLHASSSLKRLSLGLSQSGPFSGQRFTCCFVEAAAQLTGDWAVTSKRIQQKHLHSQAYTHATLKPIAFSG